MSKMLDAFLKQTKINDSLADKRDQEALMESYRKVDAAMRIMGRSQSIHNYVRVPTRGVDNTTPKVERHPQFKDYDHSLERSRWNSLGGKGSNSDGINMEPVE